MIAVDFDKTLAEYDRFEGWDVVGKPYPGALAFIKALNKLDSVIIFSARARDPRGKEAIEEWVDKYGFSDYIVGVTHEKLPEFTIMIDDRGLRFGGDYKETLKDVIRTLKGIE